MHCGQKKNPREASAKGIFSLDWQEVNVFRRERVGIQNKRVGIQNKKDQTPIAVSPRYSWMPNLNSFLEFLRH